MNQNQKQNDTLNKVNKTFSNITANVKETLKQTDKPIEELILADHKDIMAFYDQFDKANNDQEAQKWLRQFIWELARHSIAEELILYPVYKNKIPQGESYWNKSLDEHRKVKKLLKEVENLKDMNAIHNKMKEVRDSLNKHTDMEENDILPLIKQHINEAERVSFANTFLRRKYIVPTRPHPEVPDSIPTIESLIGLFVAPVDKFKDIFYAKFPDQDMVNKIKEKNHL
jgi:hemerythrin superfamily protein